MVQRRAELARQAGQHPAITFGQMDRHRVRSAQPVRPDAQQRTIVAIRHRPYRDPHRALGVQHHRQFDQFGQQEGDRHGNILTDMQVVRIDLNAKAARLRGRCAAQAGGQFADQRAHAHAAIILQFREMIAVDDRKRIDPPLDRGIGFHRFGIMGRSGVQVDQAGDDLKVVLHPMMHFAGQLALRFQPLRHFRFMGGDILADFTEGFAQRDNFLRRGAHLLQRLQHFARMIGRNRSAQQHQRADQQAIDDEPADRRRRKPHDKRQEEREQSRQGRRRIAHRHGQHHVGRVEPRRQAAGAASDLRAAGTADDHARVALPQGELPVLQGGCRIGDAFEMGLRIIGKADQLAIAAADPAYQHVRCGQELRSPALEAGAKDDASRFRRG